MNSHLGKVRHNFGALSWFFIVNCQRRCLAVLVVLCFVPAVSWAQSSGAQSMNIGSTRLSPALRIDYVSVDNLFRTGADEVSASGVLVSPELVWEADRRLLLLQASYNGTYGLYSEDEADFDDHFLRFTANGEISSRQRISASFNFGVGHEEQGTGQTLGSTQRQSEVIERTVASTRLAYTYGAKDAKGNVRAGIAMGSIGFSNLDQFTDGDDYTYVRPFGAFSYRISPDTRLLTELRLGIFDFDDMRRDRTELEFLTGFEMSATGKFGGDFLVGILKADFDDENSTDATELVAEVGLYYELTSFSRLDISFNRRLETFDEVLDNAGRSVNDDAELRWTHRWSSRLSTKASANLANIDRECPSLDDQTLTLGIEFNYDVFRWLQLGLGGSQSTRDVSACSGDDALNTDFDYDRTVLGLHVRGTL